MCTCVGVVLCICGCTEFVKQNEARRSREAKDLAAACKDGAAPIQMLAKKSAELNSCKTHVIQMLKKYRTVSLVPHTQYSEKTGCTLARISGLA